MTPDLSTLLSFMGICVLFLLAGVVIGLLWHAATAPVEPEQLDEWPATQQMHAIRAVPTDTVALPRLDVWA